MSDGIKIIGGLVAVGLVAAFSVAAGRAMYQIHADLPEIARDPRPLIAETLDKAGYSSVVLGESTSVWCPDNYNLMGREFSGTNRKGNWEQGVVCLDTQKPPKIVMKQSLFR